MHGTTTMTNYPQISFKWRKFFLCWASNFAVESQIFTRNSLSTPSNTWLTASKIWYNAQFDVIDASTHKSKFKYGGWAQWPGAPRSVLVRWERPWTWICRLIWETKGGTWPRGCHSPPPPCSDNLKKKIEQNVMFLGEMHDKKKSHGEEQNQFLL